MMLDHTYTTEPHAGNARAGSAENGAAARGTVQMYNGRRPPYYYGVCYVSFVGAHAEHTSCPHKQPKNASLDEPMMSLI